jgi:hypothetical protein
MKAKMSKKSTLTITIMACLLAVAVATTIVLAAFSASKQATTTITFSNGVQLKITGATKQTDTLGDADVYSTTANLYWNVTVGSTTDNTGAVGSVTPLDGSESVSLNAISIDVKGTPNSTVYLAVKPVVTYTTDGSAPSASTGTPVAVTAKSGQNPAWTAGADGWSLMTVSLGSTGESTGHVFTDAVSIYTATGTDADNTTAGRKYYAQIEFEASTVAIHTGA